MTETLPPSQLRPALHYLAGVVVFTSYGNLICPFLDTLPTAVLALHTATVFIFLYFCRLVVRAIKHSEPCFSSNVTIFALGGIGFALWYAALYGFPFENSLKVAFGLTLIGMVISLDLSISCTRFKMKQQSREETGAPHYQSLSAQMGLTVIFLVVMLTTLLGLVVAKEVSLVNTALPESAAEKITAILKAFFFVAMVVIGYIIVIAKNSAGLVNEQVERQRSALALAANGNFNHPVTVGDAGELSDIAFHTNQMFQKLNERFTEISLTRDITITGISALAALRENPSPAHILRKQAYVKTLAYELKKQDRFADFLTDETIDLLQSATPLYDIGKLAIADAIFLKPGKLHDDEYAVMKAHAQLGADALSLPNDNIESSRFLRFAQEMAASHHEQWDGSGYPKGLSGEEIPFPARLVALADVYDALISTRVYRAALHHEQARTIVIEGRGRHFDPDVVDAFLATERIFQNIAERYQDADMKAA